VYCEIWAWDHDPAEIAKFGAKGIILSGGPESTTEAQAPSAPQLVYDAGQPLLGICYGMQTMAAQLGGRTEGGHTREFGHARVELTAANRLLDNLGAVPTYGEDESWMGEQHGAAAPPPSARSRLDVWMSHGDRVTAAPPGFAVTASTDDLPI